MPATTKELENLVTKAQEATKHLDGELRRAAFERILDHLLSASTGPAPATSIPQEGPQNARTGEETADGVLAGEQQRIDALARYFKISPEDVHHIFDLSEEEPRLAMSTRHLPGAKSQATREIALLVAGALTALGIQTTTSLVRAAADDYGKYDSANFMTTLTSLDEISVLGKRRSSNRIIRMKVSGVEAAQAIGQRIVI